VGLRVRRLIAVVGMLVGALPPTRTDPLQVFWWGFIFPLGAFTILTVNLAKA
jgi:tellurite resistance protein TehA-like permease